MLWSVVRFDSSPSRAASQLVEQRDLVLSALSCLLAAFDFPPAARRCSFHFVIYSLAFHLKRITKGEKKGKRKGAFLSAAHVLFLQRTESV